MKIYDKGRDPVLAQLRRNNLETLLIIIVITCLIGVVANELRGVQHQVMAGIQLLLSPAIDQPPHH